MKRLCIYLTYDKQKIVDRYIGYVLKELRTCADCIKVVCNQKEVIRGGELLEEYADEIFYRENIGYDAGGFRDALCKFLGWDEVLQYEELVLINDSMFGPFRPMREIFAEMDDRPADFWGLAVHGEGVNSYVGYIQEHVQSYFIVIRTRMLHSRQFREYWENMPYFTSFKETIMRYEIGFTRYFASLGYTYGALADTKANDSDYYWNNYSQYALIPYEMMKKRNFPFFKKQPLTSRTLYCQTQENLRQAMEYIDRETEYDINLIWENIIRTLDMTDVQHGLHLWYLVSGEAAQPAVGSVAIVVFISWQESAEYVLEYLSRLPEDFHVNLYAAEGICLEPYQNTGIRCRVAGWDGEAGVLWRFAEYDYVCVLHDTDMTSHKNFSCVGKSYFFNVWENLLKDGGYAAEITARFEKESRLGFLAPPQPYFGKYFEEYGTGWSGRFEAVSGLVKRLGLDCQISEYKAPFRVTDNFWVRGRILGKLRGLRREDLPDLPYLWIYLAQDAGCYSGIVEETGYAAMNEVDMKYHMEGIVSMVRQKCGDFTDFTGMKERIRISALRAFCGKYSRILVYGAGEEVRARKSLLPRIAAYIVSDGEEKPQEIDGVEVRYLSETDLGGDCGVVLVMNRMNQLEVIPLLEARGFEDYFCI